MSKSAIDRIFEELKRRGQCSSRNLFSTKWLGRECSYYRSLQSKERQPSVEAQLNLAARLRHLGFMLEVSDHEKVADAGKAFLKLSNELLVTLLDQAQVGTVNAEFDLVS